MDRLIARLLLIDPPPVAPLIADPRVFDARTYAASLDYAVALERWHAAYPIRSQVVDAAPLVGATAVAAVSTWAFAATMWGA